MRHSPILDPDPDPDPDPDLGGPGPAEVVVGGREAAWSALQDGALEQASGGDFVNMIVFGYSEGCRPKIFTSAVND